MSRLNFLLLLIVVICALSVVNATNRQRELFISLGRAQMQERQLQQDLAQLQYQQSAQSKTSRVESVATSELKMQPVTAGRTQYLTVAGASSTAADDALSGPVSTGSGASASGTLGASATTGTLAPSSGSASNPAASAATSSFASNVARAPGTAASGASK
jgi:cell division protein FtsL